MINLDKYKNTRKDLVSGYEKKYTFEIDGAKHFFKLNGVREMKGEAAPEGESPTGFNESGEAIYGQSLIEVIVSELFKKAGVKNFVEYNLAECDGKLGCLCKTFYEPDTVGEIELWDMIVLNYLNKRDGCLYPLGAYVTEENINEAWADMDERFGQKPLGDEYGQYARTIYQVLEEISVFAKSYGYSFDVEQTKRGLAEMVVCDYFSCNNDRNATNIGFMLNGEKNPRLKLTPIFDNGYAFGKSWVGRLKPQDEMPCFYMSLGISDGGIYKLCENTMLADGGFVAADIYELAHKDPYFAEIVDGFLHADMGKIVADIEKVNGIEIDREHKGFPERFFSKRVAKYHEVEARLNKKLYREMELNQ